MLFICTVTIDPDARDESTERFMEHGLGAPKGVKLRGAWISVTMQESWTVFEADSAEAILAFYEPWTDLNVHEITPVMDFADLKSALESSR